MTNAPDRFEKFTLPEGVYKISHEKDTKVADAAKFTLEREDHTIGNLMRMQLHRDANVLFAGYQIPHPLQHQLILKVQTTHKSDPIKAVEDSLNALHDEFGDIKSQFEAQCVEKERAS